ncbi:MAG: hypothetical protein M3389_00210, partial [Actinomycetota bacterium]|nr:hypothetical protein [Actinomycetota bacterium]
HGKTTTSPAANVTISNAPSDTRGHIESTALPEAVAWDPAAGATQVEQGVDVLVANTGDRPLKATDIDIRYRWVRPDGTTAATGDKPLSADVGVSDALQTRVSVPPPSLVVTDPSTGQSSLSGHKVKHQLQFDLVDKKRGTVLSNKGNKPKDKPVEVERKSEVGLGLERFYHYEGEQLGGGMQHMVNLASGNSIVRFTPFQSPGRGLSTVVDMTYNALEDKSRSPAGNNWSLAISGITPLGMQLDPHPNKADEISGRSNKYVELVDGDGTRHRFEGKTAADGTTYWEEPAGVHLYLRVYSTTDTTRKWALTRPDRVTFFFDADGHPTSAEDRNGNRITYKLEETPPGEDPGGPKKRIVAVTDAGNRSFNIAYYSKADVKKAHVRGKVKRVTDHTGSPLDFEYYEDGNLRRLVQRGGTSAQGVFADDRAWVFSYTTSSGSGPALATAAERSNPPERVGNQSSRIYSVRDPRGNESRFTYLGSGNGNDRWKLASRIDRANQTTTYAYDTANRLTTVTKPLSRVTKYTFDADGKVTKIVNPKNEQVLVTWTGDRHVRTITDTHLSTTLSPPYREFAYNANGALLDVWDQLRNRTNFEMENVAVDANDVSGKWKAGRAIPHISQMKRKTTPKGMATATPTDDFQTVLDYDAKGNQIKVTDEEGFAEQTFYNADGTINKITDPLGHSTTYPAYDANGLPTTIVDPRNQGKTNPEKTQMSFDADGLLLWLQDPNHTFDSGSNGREYRTYFDYDPFHRLSRQSAPKSTQFQRGGANIIWTGAEYDPNDNTTAQIQPHYAASYTGAGPRTTKRYDAMDRPDLITGPDRSADPAGERTALQYDAAGRLIKKTSPRGVQSTIPNDFETLYDYDPLDRVVTEKRYEVDGAGAVTKTLRTHRCFETDGDLKSVTMPRANVATVDCALPPGFTKKFEYDAAHRVTKVTNALNQSDTTEYDANGNVTAKVNRRKARTEMAYDERDIAIRKVEALDQDVTGATTRSYTTLFEYDGARNLKREISPRGFDVNGGVPPFNDYVTTYTYDENDRRTKTELPSKGGVGKTYVHETYDANGNQTSISQPVTDSTSAPTDQKETRTYWDPAWIRTSQQ